MWTYWLEPHIQLHLDTHKHTHTLIHSSLTKCRVSAWLVKRGLLFFPHILCFLARKVWNNADIVKNNHFLENRSHDWPTAADQQQGIGSRCFQPEMTNLGSDGQIPLPQTDWNGTVHGRDTVIPSITTGLKFHVWIKCLSYMKKHQSTQFTQTGSLWLCLK